MLTGAKLLKPKQTRVVRHLDRPAVGQLGHVEKGVHVSGVPYFLFRSPDARLSPIPRQSHHVLPLLSIIQVLSRRGTLSTTGHSTNFVMWIDLPSNRADFINNAGSSDQETWVKAGVAAFTSLKY